jgi:site-specific DNA-methyltransferase (adenine-specific)
VNKVNYKIIEGNCLEVMDNLFDDKGEFVDFIFADPPYFLSNGGITCQNGKMVKVDKGDWDKSKGADVNHDFNKEWISRCQKLLKPNGSMMVSGTMHVIYSVGFAMQQLNMKLLNNIIWQKPNPPPNLACRYFTHSTETILWSAKTMKSKHLFNYPLMKKINDNKQMKDVWNFTAPKKSEKLFGKHPTQKPLDLLTRILLSATNENDLVLDPFNGSGTTGVACVTNNRNYVGIELEKSYIELTKKRIKEIENDLF